MEKVQKHIENIRRTKFSIGGRKNPLMEDFHQAVKNLSTELYAKDFHYFMELIQDSHSFSCIIYSKCNLKARICVNTQELV